MVQRASHPDARFEGCGHPAAGDHALFHQSDRRKQLPRQLSAAAQRDPVEKGPAGTRSRGAESRGQITRLTDELPPSSTYSERIFQEHVNYQQGLYYFLANDPQVPNDLQQRAKKNTHSMAEAPPPASVGTVLKPFTYQEDMLEDYFDRA